MNPFACESPFFRVAAARYTFRILCSSNSDGIRTLSGVMIAADHASHKMIEDAGIALGIVKAN